MDFEEQYDHWESLKTNKEKCTYEMSISKYPLQSYISYHPWLIIPITIFMFYLAWLLIQFIRGLGL